jgi:hypothetical protein
VDGVGDVSFDDVDHRSCLGGVDVPDAEALLQVDHSDCPSSGLSAEVVVRTR